MPQLDHYIESARRLVFYGFNPNDYPLDSPQRTFAYYVGWVAAAGKRSGLYKALLGPQVDTYDWKPYVWYHVEFGFDIRPEAVETDNIVIHLIDLDTSYLDTAAMEQKLAELKEDAPPYDQPLLYVLLDWMKSEDHFIFFKLDYDYRWKYGYGREYPRPELPVFSSKVFAPDYKVEMLDMESSVFWSRSMDCSSLVLWVILWGLYKSGFKDYRKFFLDNPRAAAAVDCISPGILYWALDFYKFIRCRKEVKL